MFARLITDSVTRRPRRKMLGVAACALGVAVVTAALSVALDVGDRLAADFPPLGANLVVPPQADSLPLEIGGVDYRPANSGAYLPESDLPKIKSVFWHNNIIAFAPELELSTVFYRFDQANHPLYTGKPYTGKIDAGEVVPVMGTWSSHNVHTADGSVFVTGAGKTSPWWHVDGDWFEEEAKECVVGRAFARTHGLKIGDKISLQGQEVAPKGTIQLDDESLRVSFRETLSFTVKGILSTGGPEERAIVVPLAAAQQISGKAGLYRKLYVLALTKPEDAFAHRDPKTMDQKDFERWSCTPYVSSIAYSIQEVLPGSDVRVIHRIADSEGQILTRVRSLLWLVTLAALLAAALAVGASSAASVIERRSELALMKALGAGSGMVGFLLAAEQLLLAFVGGTLGYAIGYILARIVGAKIFGIPPLPSFLVLSVVLGLAILVTLLGSALPLRRATRCEPAPILRGA